MKSSHSSLPGQLKAAIVELCRRESFYCHDLRIEGTLCIVSDNKSVVITQIKEHIGETEDEINASDRGVILDATVKTINETGSEDGNDVSVKSSIKNLCPFCNRSFRFRQSLKDHISVHTGSRPRLCKFCGQSFSHLATLCSHVRRKHHRGTETRVSCRICKKNFRHQLALKQHVMLKHSSGGNGKNRHQTNQSGLTSEYRYNDVDQFCSDIKEENKFSAPKISQNSSANSQDNSNTSVQDLIASQAGLFQASLQLQQKAMAMGVNPQNPMSAMFPGLPFPFPNPDNQARLPVSQPERPVVNQSPQDASNTTYERTEDGKFQCPFCDKAYNFKHTLKDHVNKHTGARPHVCKHCGDSFSHLASLCNHIKRRHEDKIPQEFKCELCHERFMNYQSVKQHYTWRHKDQKFPERFSYSGSPGGKKTLTGAAQATVTSTPTQYQSPTTQMIYNEACAPSASIPDWSTNIPPAQSQSVFPGMSNPQQMKQEPNNLGIPEVMDSLPHFEDQDFEALISDPKDDLSRSPSPNSLIHTYFDHVDIPANQGHYKYRCRWCNNLFKIRNSLYEHINSHLGKKPYICQTCGDSFTHHSSLHNHVKNKHTSLSPAEREALYKHSCLSCQRKFRYPSELERHYKTNPDHEHAMM